jgi:hypothetical protein
VPGPAWKLLRELGQRDVLLHPCEKRAYGLRGKRGRGRGTTCLEGFADKFCAPRLGRQDDRVIFTATVKAARLGGTPYRSGSNSYFLSDPVGDDDAKGIGA